MNRSKNDSKSLRHVPRMSPKVSSGTAQALLLHSWQLHSSHREVFILCEIQQLSSAEVSTILGLPAAEVERKLQSARQEMSELLTRLSEPRPASSNGD